LDDATLVFDIAISPSNRKLRLATHGKGIWERDMLPPTITHISGAMEEVFNIPVYPNPADESILINLPSLETWSVYDSKGRRALHSGKIAYEGENSGKPLMTRLLRDGLYLLEATSAGKKYTSRFAVIHKK
jgi:hypothetical protein